MSDYAIAWTEDIEWLHVVSVQIGKVHYLVAEYPGVMRERYLITSLHPTEFGPTNKGFEKASTIEKAMSVYMGMISNHEQLQQ